MNTKINLAFEIDEVNLILNVLADAAYGRVANIIPKIIEQGRPQAEAIELEKAKQEAKDKIEKVEAEAVN